MGACRLDAKTALKAAGLAGRIILESGGETYRAEETACRMCDGFGYAGAEAMAFPTGIMLSVCNHEGCCESCVVRVRERGTHLDRIDKVNAVSRMAANGSIDATEAERQLNNIASSPRAPQSLLTAACAISSGMFTLMFGGGIWDFAAAAACGGLTQSLTPLFARLRVPGILRALAGGALTALITLVAAQAIRLDMDKVISGAIMPLLPGLAMTAAIRDTLRGDLVSGVARGMEALLSAVLLAAGVGITLSLWGGMH
jgi:uncharacterized membrane protein YjjP (DUF1212 family)